MSAAKKRLLWSLLVALGVLASGFVPPQAVGLAPTAEGLRQRFQALGAQPGESARELVDRLGIGEPDLAVLRRSRPGDRREALDLFAAEGGGEPARRPATLAPMDATRAEWLQLMWKPTDPWLIAALDRLARGFSPGAQTILWTFKDRVLPEREVFEIVGTRARGWEAGAGPWAGGSPAGQQVRADVDAALGR